MDHFEQTRPAAAGDFQTTHWSLVLAAGETDSAQAQRALARLCEIYWYPIYAFIRRRGNEVEPARDLTQEFFARLVGKQYVKVADQEKGRFRTFLLSCVDHFLSNERKKELTLKRGGHVAHVSLDDSLAEDRYRHEPVEDMSPDRLLDRRWAFTLLEQALDKLRQEYAHAGKAAQFEALQAFLSGAKDAPCSFAEIGAQIGMSEAASRQAASRMRSRFGEVLRQSVAQTVATPVELEAELSHLRSVLSVR